MPQKTLIDFINDNFMLRPTYDITSHNIIMLTETYIVSISHDTIIETPYKNGHIIDFLDAFAKLTDIKQFEDNYNFECMYMNDETILVDKNYANTIVSKQITKTINYLKFPNGQEYYFE